MIKIQEDETVAPVTKDDLDGLTPYEKFERLQAYHDWLQRERLKFRKRAISDKNMEWVKRNPEKKKLLDRKSYYRKKIKNFMLKELEQTKDLKKLMEDKKMKWTDKYGNVIEGTVDDYLKFVEAISDLKIKKPTKKEVFKDDEIVGEKQFFGVCRTNVAYTPEENEIIKNNFHKHVKKLKKLLPGRTVHSIYNQKCKLRKRMMELGDPRVNRDGRVKNNAGVTQIQRLKFMGHKIAYYMKLYNWDRAKAGQQASMDWEAMQSGGKLKVPVTENKPVSPEIKKNIVVYKLLCASFDDKNVVTVDVYSTRQDAEKEKQNRELADLSIGARTTYFIIEE